jgi:membrane protease YdiL (CAAX protease family)
MSTSTSSSLSASQTRHALSLWTYYALTLFILLVFLSPILAHLYNKGYGTGLSCFGEALILLIAILFAFIMKLPASYYGFIKTSNKAIIESIVYSFLFCALTLIIKYIFIHSVSGLETYPLWIISNGTPSTTPRLLFAWLLLYCICAPFQAFVYHSVFQGPLTELSQTRAKAWLTILYTTLFFTCVHTIFGYAFAMIVFLPGLIWSCLYYRHRSFLSISISHMIVGGVLMFLVGIEPFIVLANDALTALS